MPAEATSIFCHNCGTVSEVGGGAAFACGNCGSDFVEAVDGGDGTLPAGMEDQGETFVVFAPTDQLTGDGPTVRITQRTYTNGEAGEGAVRRRRRRRNRTGTSFNPILLDVMDMFHNGAGADVAAEALVSRLEEAFNMHQQAERATVTRATRSDVIENLASHEVTSDMVEGDDTCAICRVPFATDDDAVRSLVVVPVVAVAGACFVASSGWRCVCEKGVCVCVCFWMVNPWITPCYL